MKTDFFRIFKEDARLRKAVRKKQLRWALKYVGSVLFTTLLLETLAVAIGIGAPWVFFIPIVIIGISIALFKPWKILKCEPSLWRITGITHEYSTVAKKGTAGLERMYTHLQGKHELLIVASSMDARSNAETDLTAPAHLYRVYREGDVILKHPAFQRCACLTNPSVSICIGCGEVQGANERVCHSCGLPLFGVFSLRQDDFYNRNGQ